MISKKIKTPILNCEIEKNKEIKPKRFNNLSIEYINKDAFNSELNSLESILLKNQNELSNQKLNDVNKNNLNDKQISNSNNIPKSFYLCYIIIYRILFLCY